MDPSSAAILYRLVPADPGAHEFRVTLRIAEPDADGQIVSLPAWIPGSYLLRDYARHVLRVSATDSAGELAVRKLDKHTWQADPARGALVINARIYANDLSVRGAYLDTRQAFINGVCVFFRVHGQAHRPCVLQIDPPAGLPDEAWQVATAMQRLSGAEGQFGTFMAPDYDCLIDQPILLGRLSTTRFTVGGVEHRVALAGRHNADLRRLADDMALVCAEQARLFDAEMPMSSYQFLVMVLGSGYGGLEHRDSSALTCARGDLPRPGMQGVPAAYRKFLGLVSHEYLHAWHVKRIRPAEFLPYRLDRENYTRQLWLFEGFTSYYDDLALLRAGLISTESYLELLGRTLTRVYRSGGRRLQTLEEASFDAWIRFYRQDENAVNSILSYYSKGAMVALCLDLELRLRSDGRHSLDDLMRALWTRYGKTGTGVPDGACEQLAEELAGQPMKEFFDLALRSTVDPPAGILLAQFGVQLKLRPAEAVDDAGGTPGQRLTPRPWLGAETAVQDGRVLLAQVVNGGPAAAAGASAGDELVAINELRVGASNFEQLLDQLDIGSVARLHLFRRDELLECELTVQRPPRDRAWLSLDPGADAASQARRALWLGQ